MAKRNSSRNESTVRNVRASRKADKSLKGKIRLLEKKLTDRIKAVESEVRGVTKSTKKALAKIG